MGDALRGFLGSLRLLVLFVPLVIAGCAAESVWAPEEEVQRALYRHDGPPSITLFTMVNNRSGEGAHSGLLVNSSHRAVFDPAGSFRHPQVPERNDVHFGMTDRAVEFYIDYHARETFHVVKQEVVVTPEQAAIAMKLIQEYGPVPPAQCTTSIGRILRQVPGFEDMPSSPFPLRAKRYFDTRPGVVTQTFFDNSPGDRGDLIAVPRIR